MPTYKKRVDFYLTQEGKDVEQTLQSMVDDNSYNTESSYSANTELYPDNRMPFVHKHMNYLRSNPAVNPRSYIANLRLMTRIR